MERGSSKKNQMLDDEMKEEAEALERSGGESHSEDHLKKEEDLDSEPDSRSK